MEQNMMNNNNNTLRYTFAGVLLFIAALGFYFAYRAAVIGVELSITFMSLVSVTAAITVLSKAIKDDINRLSRI